MRHGFSPWERGIARSLLFFFLTTTSLPASSQQWEDPNNATFGDDVRLENSADGLTTEFSIDSTRTTIGWTDLQQPEDNTLIFRFENPTDQSAVANFISAPHPSAINGAVECIGGTCAFINQYGIYVGDQAILDVGNLALISGSINEQQFLSAGDLDATLQGFVQVDGQIFAEGNVALLGRSVINRGEIRVMNGALLLLAGHEVTDLQWDEIQNNSLARAEFSADLTGGSVENSGRIDAPNAALIGRRVENHGEIFVQDGALLMAAADGLWIRRFDQPVTVRIPNPAEQNSSGDTALAGYGIENHGTINAGLGHVRLSAADPLGYGIRQGATGSISARTVDIAAGEDGRVHLSGEIDAIANPETGIGGDIDVTGRIIALVDADIDASGPLGGGKIRIGGEQEGRGELQRAEAVLVDRDTTIRADALEEGDGGRLIVFSEELTSIDGELSARGGTAGGDGGFIETSGHRNFAISTTPDVSAPQGEAGAWLIDPFNIEVVSDVAAGACSDPSASACLNRAIDDILDPDFDNAIFDGTIRTLSSDSGVVDPTNQIAASLLARALSVGTNITLSTLAFGSDRGTQRGDITISAPIIISNADTLPGTAATLTLLAAGDILINNDIISGTVGQDPNLALSLVLRANDTFQDVITDLFSYDRLQGDVRIDANISTGGGSFDAQGVGVDLAAGRRIETMGGAVSIRSGALDQNGFPIPINRTAGTPGLNAALGDEVGGPPGSAASPFGSAVTPPVAITISGTIDSSRSGGTGGNVQLTASPVRVATGARQDVVPGLVSVTSTGSIRTGGGSLGLSGGQLSPTGEIFVGNVSVEGELNTCAETTCTGSDPGGDISILAFRRDPNTANLSFFDTGSTPADGLGGSQGGQIILNVNAATGVRTGGGNLVVGGDSTRSILMDGGFFTNLTTQADERGLVRITALDTSAVQVDGSNFGEGTIGIGGNGTTRIETGGLTITGREVSTSDATAPQSVTLIAEGESSKTLTDVVAGQLQIEGRKSVELGANSRLQSETIRVLAATSPSELTEAERGSLSPALAFLGDQASIPGGVLLDAAQIEVRTGDGTTATTSLFVSPSELLEDGLPTDLALTRNATANYEGLQLRSGGARPDEVTIAQDADFTISGNATPAEGELNLAGAFGGAGFGADGLELTLESSDGILTIADAAGMNGATSNVNLLGGLFLPETPPTGAPVPDTVITPNTVVFGDGVTALAGAAAVSVNRLRVSTPGDYRLTAQAATSITAVNELTFEAGRNTGNPDASGRGNLFVDGVADGPLILAAAQSLSLLAAASGFGDLVFDTALTTSLLSNEINLRAGAGNQTQNVGTATPSRITGASTGISIRDAAGNAFGSAASPTDVAFRYQQDAEIDTETDLPDITQFGLTVADGFRDAGDVVYSVRSDQGFIRIDDGLAGGASENLEAGRFQDAALELISSLPLQLASDFRFQGDQVVLGGLANFQYSQALATAFNDTESNANSRITLRSGLGGFGALTFAPTVSVIASRIDLIAGDGIGGQAGSNVFVAGAEFDLSAATGDRIFVLQQDDATFTAAGLPTLSQFVGGLAGAPDILVVRSDSGLLNLSNLDFAAMPINTAGTTRRLVLEADTLQLSQTDATNPNLNLVAPNGLRLRLRTNDLILTANSGDLDETGGRVLAGASNSVISGVNADFNTADLLIEGFDPEVALATPENLSALSANPAIPGQFDLSASNGRGPQSVQISQNGTVSLADLPEQTVFSGQLNRTREDDADGSSIPTQYLIQSNFGSVSIDNSKVDGSFLTIVGVDDSATTDDRAFNIAADTYNLSSFTAQTADSIVIQAGTVFNVEDQLSLFAGLIAAQPTSVVTSTLPRLEFETGGGASIQLNANRISLAAGPAGQLIQPDGTTDGLDGFLSAIDFGGLLRVNQTGDARTSSFAVRQSEKLDVDASLIAALATGTGQFDQLEFDSVQGESVTIDGIGDLAAAGDHLTVRTDETGKIIADVGATGNAFDLFAGNVLLRSNDIKIQTTDPSTQLDLATSKLELRSFFTDSEFVATTDADFGLIRDETQAAESLRPILRIEQVADFGAAADLPSSAQFTIEQLVQNLDGSISATSVQRSDLTRVDLELTTTGPGVTLTLDNAIRDAAFDSHLILRSAGRVAIDLTGAAPGFDAIEAAALRLVSLDIETDTDSIGSDNEILFNIAGFPTPEQIAQFMPPDSSNSRLPFDISTQGDQRYSGDFVLQESLDLKGRDIRFAGDISAPSPTSDLRILTSGRTIFEGNIGSAANRLGSLTVLFESTAQETPVVEFGQRDSADQPILGDQAVFVENNIVFGGKIETPGGLIAGQRTPGAPVTTIGKALGDLLFDSNTGSIELAAGERIAAGGNLILDAENGSVAFSDAAAVEIDVISSDIQLLRRVNGFVLDANGDTQKDAGPTIVANAIRFVTGAGADSTPTVIGAGADPIFGIPNPFNTSAFPSFLSNFSVFQISPTGQSLRPSDFNRGGIVPAVIPAGASRSDLSGAFGPDEIPVASRLLADPGRVRNPNRLAALGVEVREARSEVIAARLSGAAVIDDLGGEYEEASAYISESRLDAEDTETAIELYEKIFGAQDERAAEVRTVLQDALDRYLEDTRARRVVGFELRRFVKNRPSTLLNAYQTLDDLDDLFRFHRRLGLSPGEYRRIQRTWLERIQPEGITLDELAETIHPSRYVRGSDILDIFGR